MARQTPTSPPTPSPRAIDDHGAASRARLLAAALFALAVGTTQVEPLRSPDLFWNIQLGRVILEQRSLPERDPLTYTTGGRHVAFHEWGSQVLLAAVDHAGGPWALRVMRGTLIATFLLLVGLALARAVRTPEAVLLGQLAVWLSLRPRAFLRPHLVGWVALAALVVWFGGRGRVKLRARHYLVLLMAGIVWINLHSSALLLPVLLGLLAIETAAWALLARARGGPSQKKRLTCRLGHAHLGWRPLLGSTAVAAAATLVQPEGLSLLRYARQTAALNRDLSTEWMPLTRPDVWRQYPEVLLLTLGLGLAITAMTLLRLLRARTAGSHAEGPARYLSFPGALFSLAAVSMALWTRRATELLWLPVLFVWAETSSLASPVLARLSKRSPACWLRWSFTAGLLLAAVSISLPGRGAIFASHPYARGRFPEEAARFIAEVQPEGHLFNPDGWGGFLSYQLYPHYRTFLDGRLPLAGRRLILDSHRILVRRSDPAPLLDRYAIEILLEPTRLYVRTRALDPASFELAWGDEVSVLLLRAGPHLRGNRRRVCAYYRRHPRQLAHASWPFRVRVPPGAVSPTDIPSALGRCQGAVTPGKQAPRLQGAP